MISCRGMGQKARDDGAAVTVKIMENPEFHDVDMDVSADAFNDAGFTYGDSCEVEFSNGYLLKEVPYYNGYYARTGLPVIVAYPGHEYVHIAFCNGEPLWDEAGCREGDTVSVTLKERGKYLTGQTAMSMVYSNDIKDYPSRFHPTAEVSLGRKNLNAEWSIGVAYDMVPAYRQQMIYESSFFDYDAARAQIDNRWRIRISYTFYFIR